MNRRDAQDHLIGDFKARQRNVLWPDAMVNSSDVNALLWKGARNATKIQRTGIAIFGLAFACIGAASESGAYERHKLFLALFGLPWLALAARLILNAFRRNPKPGNAEKH